MSDESAITSAYKCAVSHAYESTSDDGYHAFVFPGGCTAWNGGS
jgi:hypothetical protein